MPFSAVYPIILGQNVGTCVTALLAGIGTNKNAKRTAIIHLYYNVIGSVIFMLVFTALTRLAFMDTVMNSMANSGTIANFHTIFNVITTILLLPFAGVLEKLAMMTYKDKKGKEVETTLMLDDRILSTPSLAISKCMKVVSEMGSLSFENYKKAISLFDLYNEEVVKKIERKEEEIDKLQDNISMYLTKIIDKALSDADTKRITYLMSITTDFERIADYSVQLVKQAKAMHEGGIEFHSKTKKELTTLTTAITDIITITIDSFREANLELAYKIEPLEEVIDAIINKLRTNNMKTKEKSDTKIVFSELLIYLERIADHCSNVGICTVGNNHGKNYINRHEYIRQLHSSMPEEYIEDVTNYKEKYMKLIEV